MWLKIKLAYWQYRYWQAQQFFVSLEDTVAKERQRAARDVKVCAHKVRTLEIAQGMEAAAQRHHV